MTEEAVDLGPLLSDRRAAPIVDQHMLHPVFDRTPLRRERQWAYRAGHHLAHITARDHMIGRNRRAAIVQVDAQSGDRARLQPMQITGRINGPFHIQRMVPLESCRPSADSKSLNFSCRQQLLAAREIDAKQDILCVEHIVVGCHITAHQRFAQA